MNDIHVQTNTMPCPAGVARLLTRFNISERQAMFATTKGRRYDGCDSLERFRRPRRLRHSTYNSLSRLGSFTYTPDACHRRVSRADKRSYHHKSVLSYPATTRQKLLPSWDRD